MAFTYDPNLGDPLSRARALLLDTVQTAPLFSDEAITAYHTLFGVDEGTAQLAVILKNRYGNQPTEAHVQGLGGATWGDRMVAWDGAIAAARGGAVSGETTPNVADALQVELLYADDPYSVRDCHGDVVPRSRWKDAYPW